MHWLGHIGGFLSDVREYPWESRADCLDWGNYRRHTGQGPEVEIMEYPTSSWKTIILCQPPIFHADLLFGSSQTTSPGLVFEKPLTLLPIAFICTLFSKIDLIYWTFWWIPEEFTKITQNRPIFQRIARLVFQYCFMTKITANSESGIFVISKFMTNRAILMRIWPISWFLSHWAIIFSNGMSTVLTERKPRKLPQLRTIVTGWKCRQANQSNRRDGREDQFYPQIACEQWMYDPKHFFHFEMSNSCSLCTLLLIELTLYYSLPEYCPDKWRSELFHNGSNTEASIGIYSPSFCHRFLYTISRCIGACGFQFASSWIIARFSAGIFLHFRTLLIWLSIGPD